MNQTYSSKPRVLLSSIVGLVVITGLVHAHALEPNVEAGLFLRPELSPYVSSVPSTEPRLSADEEGIITSTSADTSETRVYIDEVSSTTSDTGFTNYLRSTYSNEGGSDEATETLFNRLKKKLNLDSAAIVSKLSARETIKPLMISSVFIANNSSSSVTFKWELNKFADVTIYYSTSSPVTAKNSTPSVKVSAFRFASEATIENLQQDMTYNYLIVVDNSFNKESTTLTGSFRTAPQ